MSQQKYKKTKTHDVESKTIFNGDFEENQHENSALEKNENSKGMQKNSEKSWLDFVPLKKALAIFWHPVLVSLAMGGFAFTIWLAEILFPDEPGKSILHWIDTIGIILLMIALLFTTLREIIKDK